MISRLHDGQLQWGARDAQCKPYYNHTKAFRSPSERTKRGKMGGGRKSNKEEKRWKGISSGGGGGGDLQCSFRFNKGGSFKIVFSFSAFFFFFLKGKSTVKHQPHINGAWQTFNSNLSDFRGFYWRCVSSFMPVKSIVKFQEEDLFENNSLHSGSHLPAVPLSLLSTWTAEPIWTFISTESPATSKAAFRDVGTSRWLRDDIGQEKHKKVGLHSQLKYASIEFQLNLFSCFYWFMVVWVTVLLDGLYLTLWGLSRHWWWALSNPNPNSNPGLDESFCIDLFFQGL